MSNVAVQKVEGRNTGAVPVLEQLERRLHDIRRRAFELFELRGGEAGHDLEDWLVAEREVLGWPVLEVEESDRQYDFRVILPGFKAKEVGVTATPSEIVVHARSTREKKSRAAEMSSTYASSNEVFRRIDLAQPIAVDQVKARLDDGTLRITAAKAGSVRPTSASAAA